MSSARSPVSALKLLLAVVGLVGAGTALAAAAVATVTHASGTVSVKRSDGSSRLLAPKSEVFEGDRINTEADTYTRLKFNDGGEVVLRPNTQLVVANYSYREDRPEGDNAVLSLLRGGLRAITGLLGKRNRDKVSVQTATATIGIRGTHFGLLLCNDDCAGVQTVSGKALENGLHLDVADGAVVATNNGGSLQFNLGQFGYIKDINTPPILVPPADGVRVTIPSRIGSGVGTSGNDAACRI